MSSSTDAGTARAAERFAVWPSIAAWSGGLIQLALGAGAVTTAGGGVALHAAGVVLLALGGAAIAWGTAALLRGRAVVPRLGMIGALGGAFAAVAGFVLDPARMSILAVAPAVALLVVASLGCAVGLRAERAPSRRDARMPGRPRIVELIVGAVLAAAVVTPALAATEAGFLAPVDGGTVVVPDTGHHH